MRKYCIVFQNITENNTVNFNNFNNFKQTMNSNFLKVIQAHDFDNVCQGQSDWC